MSNKFFEYEPQGVCAKKITFELDGDGKLHNVKFTGGCPGNLVAIPKLIEGSDAAKIAGILKGNLCLGRGAAMQTSCADQLARAIEGALAS
ncbi:MAG: TIGR03905 family TSCPD domain-containing protein [Synergistaceae bacterium]|nr:TIGR03905 family TSCPD domain-containing protein [Synergistaceae bacterium]MBQ9404244.1 TIGR03905 family TSCPD domain-containing protein [Synergistaceae bacterium]MBQ9595830.1 TIGR03905 family TSCPD domain-containing protein [Synergistaceae bacterium]